MDSPLGTGLANIIVKYYDKEVFLRNKNPVRYIRFVDDTFAILNEESHRDSLFFGTIFFTSLLDFLF